MAKLAVLALLGMLALAAAVDVETQKEKKHYKDEKEEHHNPANVVVKHYEWDLTEHVHKTHPCAPEYEIFGSTVAQSADLKDGEDVVGHVTWSGIVVKHELCADCKDYKAADYHTVKVNYQVIFEFTHKHKGQIICGVVAPSIFSEDKVTCAVTGGTGAFNGAWGSITWEYGSEKKSDPSKYSFDIYLPKIHKDKDYKESEKKYSYEEDKDYKY